MEEGKDKERIQRLVRTVRAELHQWVGSHYLPDDEYDALIPALVRMLDEGVPVDALASHLRDELGPDLGTDVVDDPRAGVEQLAGRLRTGAS